MGPQLVARLASKDQAEEACKQMLELYPNHAMTHHRVGIIPLHAGNIAQAMSSLEESLRLDPEDEYAQQGLYDAQKQRDCLMCTDTLGWTGERAP